MQANIFSNDLTQMVNFSTWILGCDFHIPALLVLFLSSGTSTCSAIAILPLEHSDAPIHRIAYDYSHADWDGLHHHLIDVPWKDIFKPSAFVAASEICE